MRDDIKKNIITLLLFIFSTVAAQEVTVYVYDVVTGEEYLQDNQAEVKIYIDTTVPIYSYSFTLAGFNNVLTANSTSIQPDCLAWSFFGGDNINILDNYFYGGGIDGDIIPIISGGEFLSIVATFDSVLLEGNPSYLTFDEILPGMNGQGTNFFTYNEESGAPELVEHSWISRTWMIGYNQTYDYLGQDCGGEIWGLANWDDCSLCTGGNTGFEYNYYLDCADVCGGSSLEDNFDGCCEPNEDGQFSIWFLDSDGDGLGENFGANQNECEELGGLFDNGICFAYACERPDGFVGNSDDEDLGRDGVYDECGVCDNDPSNNSYYIDETSYGGVYDCTGDCFGTIPQLNWYPDCDLDGMADSYVFQTICGIPVEGDEYYLAACPYGGNIISINPNNHTFDPHIECTSNQVDDCGTCDGVGVDCRGTCSPNSPVSNNYNCTQPGYGWGDEMTVMADPLDASDGSLTPVYIEEGCRLYIGYESDNYTYSYLNGLDLCGQCYVADLDSNYEDYIINYSCSGCTDINASNHVEDALFDDGSCYFQLYAGDVNRDGIVDELDLNGIAEFWNYWTDNERQGASILWFPQFAQDDYWYDPSGSLSTSSCPMFADADGDAMVNSSDISAVLLNWGNTVDENYYYPWGLNGETPNCLSYDIEQYRENLTEILDYIIDNYPYNSTYDDAIDYLVLLLGLDLELNRIPDKFTVPQNFPNPFNPVTKFPIELSEISNVTLRIYDINGGLLHSHKEINMDAGVYNINTPFVWDTSFLELASGVYIYSFELSNGDIDYNKLMLIK